MYIIKFHYEIKNSFFDKKKIKAFFFFLLFSANLSINDTETKKNYFVRFNIPVV